MKKSVKRERFLAVVLGLIHKKGFKATTVRDMAQELNCEVSNVYNYIDSKQSLLEEYLFDVQNKFLIAIDAILDSRYSPDEKLRHVISSYIQITLKHPYEQALLVNEWRNLEEPRLQEFVERRISYESKLQHIIRNGIGHGQFKVQDEELTAQTILATLRWLHNKHLDSKSISNPMEIEKQLMDFIFTGISRRV
ncbi:TetR/AcrR family transcriptional regulator [Maribacter algarum]|uniref:TetR/AcrR family transcriptional regulator n=1 Tax=Maribacter algarum (ex Zhang et al. 2020) TaxID=2578118 RepID=A0A5S3PPG2_9FLAO|nr:TetR family transcriptional regulator [Maribacter algarum]TMM56261.1 TetR/AcrR family transcriptional regulator [Maribacter algarum]